MRDIRRGRTTRRAAFGAVLLALVGFGLGVGAAPAAGYGGSPRAPEIAVSATVVAQGEQLAVEGRFFTPHGRAYLTLHSSPVFLGSVTVSPLGTFAIDIRIPETAATGVHEIEALDIATGDIAGATITVQALPAGVGNAGGGLGSTGVAIVALLALGAALVVAGAGSAGLGRRRTVAA